jgi:plasmid stabilization system protein ParE
MTYRIEFLGVAEAELEDAVDWYELQSKNAAPLFVLVLDNLLERIKENPRLFPVVYMEMRKASLPNYPYSIIYEIHDPDVVLILGIVHQKRDPEHWLKR